MSEMERGERERGRGEREKERERERVPFEGEGGGVSPFMYLEMSRMIVRKLSSTASLCACAYETHMCEWKYTCECVRAQTKYQRQTNRN